MTETETREKVAAKIEALLRKAEATNFGPEAEAFIAKAHELMARYSIEEAMLHKASGVRDEVVITHVKVSKKGAAREERWTLLNVIAKHNRCRAVVTDDYMTVIGFKTDTEFVNQMYVSLGLQMFDAMLSHNYNTQREMRSFCQGFCTIIDKRLAEVNRKVEAEVAPQGSSTALVLRDRSLAVQDKVKEEFPQLGYVRHTAMKSDPRAFEHGRQAARNADLGQTGISPNRKGIGQ